CGPTPSIGDILPPKTRYKPLNELVFSIAITSLTSSTTHIMDSFRFGLEQISQMSTSLILWQDLQNLISLRIVFKASESAIVCSLGCLNMCNTKRNAVRFPIPGSWDISFTARSKSFEENSIVCEITILC